MPYKSGVVLANCRTRTDLVTLLLLLLALQPPILGCILQPSSGL